MPIETTRKELFNHPTVSRTTVQGRSAVLFSLPFLGFGIYIVLLALNIIPVGNSHFHVPRHLVAAFGGLFFMAGLSVLVCGLQGLMAHAQFIQRQKEHPHELWLIDFPWDKRGTYSDNMDRVLNACYGCLGCTLFLVPFNWFAFFADVNVLFVKIVLAIFNIILLISWGYTVYLLLQFIKYGRSFLQFDRFPFLIGDQVSVTLKTRRPIEGLKSMTFILRCIQERYEVRGTGKNRQSVVAVYQIYAETITVEELGHYQPQGGLQWPISFAIPNDPEFLTQLSQRPARYWQLEVKAVTPGIDFAANFLVPVYKGN